MRVRAGTSGFSYDEWSGSFYPEGTPAGERLAHYGTQLSTVELNNTFYRMPRQDVVRRWGEAVPADFRFVLKASRRITHQARLGNVEDALAYLWRSALELGDRLGPILFQCPPTLRKDVERLRAFLGKLPTGCRAVLEFRHPTWEDGEVHGILRDAGVALCHADSLPAEGEPRKGEPGDGEPEEVEDGPPADPAAALVPTASFGYLRLRRPAYAEQELDRWEAALRAQPWEEAYVFFKHEEAGAAPRMARAFGERFAS